MNRQALVGKIDFDFVAFFSCQLSPTMVLVVKISDFVPIFQQHVYRKSALLRSAWLKKERILPFLSLIIAEFIEILLKLLHFIR